MKNRIYVFDWDDNIIHMPTKIRMKIQKNGVLVDIELSTEEYAKVRTNPEYFMDYNSLDNFIDDDSFIKDVNIALESSKSLGPSFKKFKECLLYGNSFAIITARGHNPDIVAKGIYNLIIKTFTNVELLQISKAILLKYSGLMDYFKKQKIYCISSQIFNDDFNVDNNHPSEIKKTMALESYISSRLQDSKDFDISAKISIGFSDDDIRNVLAIEEFIKTKLIKSHPDVHFVVYDTSNKNSVIKKPI
jgi:hypothetical protein